MFIEGEYSEPFLFAELPLKAYYYRDFNCLDYDYIYQYHHTDNFFFSC
jgi:hypothetical protein